MPGIYIHIPFCNKRCTYCDFFLVTNKNLIGKFLQSLHTEIKLNSEKFSGEHFDTIYFGGGTPSLLSDSQFSEILGYLKNNFDIAGDAEITLEANPEDFAERSVKEYVKAGLNRISFGVQSFIDEELKFLTRYHTPEMAEKVISQTGEHIGNINIDIIYSLPDQPLNNLEYSLKKCIDLEAKHISAYSLTFEPNTVLFKSMESGSVKKNSDELDSEMFGFIHELLTFNGFDHYEISNYAKKRFESRHNLKYWNRENYLGLGPSSHSLHNNKRWNNFRNLGKYINALENRSFPQENLTTLSEDQGKFEFIMLNLRSKGISLRKYEKLFREDFSVRYGDAVNDLLKHRYAEIDEDKFALNERGYVLADEIIARYF